MNRLDDVTRHHLGQLLRDLRKGEGLTLKELSVEAGVTPSALSQFESGRTEPSLGTLWKLGRALNASLFDFFALEPSQSVEVTPSSMRTTMTYERVRYGAITRSRNRTLDLFFLHLEPGAGQVREPVTHAGQEAGVVISGSMDVIVAGEAHRLGPGDGIWFLSTQPHTFAVVGDEQCISVWADTLPDHEPKPDENSPLFPAASPQNGRDHS
jgi:transcriptional regulator with XRE-family HTH domain